MFKFKGISSDSMGVIIEEESLFLTKSSQRYENIEINGRDGSILNELGYSNIEIPITAQIINTGNLDAIFDWLNGPGEFEYNNRITNAYFYSEVIPERKSAIKVADITFIRSPFWKKSNDSYVTVTNKVENEGNIYSKPIIRLEKTTSNTVDITIAGVRFTYNFNNESYVEIDCENYTTLYEGLNRNRHIEIGYEFPKLNPGDNNITINSGAARIKIKSKDRWL